MFSVLFGLCCLLAPSRGENQHERVLFQMIDEHTNLFETVDIQNQRKFVNKFNLELQRYQQHQFNQSLLHAALRGAYRWQGRRTKILLMGANKEVQPAQLEPWGLWVVHRLLKSAGTALDKRDHLGMDTIGLATLFRFHEVLQQTLSLQVPPILSSLDNPSQSINMEFYSRSIAPALRIAIANRDIKATCILTQSTASSAATSTNTFISCERDLRQRLTSCVWNALALHDENITDFHDLLLQIESTLCNVTCSSSASSSTSSSSTPSPFTADAPSECPFQHRDVTNLTVKSFYEEFVKRQQPVFLRGVTQGWAAWEDWKRNTLLRRVHKKRAREKRYERSHGNAQVLTGDIPYAELFGAAHATVTLAEYIQHLDDDNNKAYVFDYEIVDSKFPRAMEWPASLMGALGCIGDGDDPCTQQAQSYRQFILGPRSSGREREIFLQEKHWFLLPPASSFYSNMHPTNDPRIVSILSSSSSSSSPSSSASGWRWEYPEDFTSLFAQREPSDTVDSRPAAEERPSAHSANIFHCVQQSGEVMYVPRFWGHATINSRESIGVAMEFDRLDC